MKFIFILTFLWIPAQLLNVLFYLNAFGKSHQDFCDSLINSLVEKGHDVDLIIARINNVEGSGKNNASRIYSFGFKNGSPWGKSSHLTDPFEPNVFSFGGFRQYHAIANDLCEIGLDDNKLMEFLSQKRYDIGIVATFDYCGIGILSKNGVGSIATFNAVPLMATEAIMNGLPNPASNLIPLFQTGEINSMYGRFWNLLNWGYVYFVHVPEVRAQQLSIFRKRYGDSFDIDEISRRIDVCFVNSNEIIEKPRPLSHRIRYIGGINLRSPKPVSQEIDKILSISKKGTIIFSFGTQIISEVYPRYAVKNFVKVFKKFSEYTFIWKYDIQPGEEQLFADAPNIFLLKWLPQTDLLYDNRVIGFISHVGLNSFNEASYAGKTIVAVPLFADQTHNAENGVYRGTTYVLDKTNLNENSIETGLYNIIFNESYRRNASKIGKLLNEKPGKLKEQFVKWVEFSANNPGLHDVFELPGSQMSIFNYYCIDVILLLSIAALFTFYVVFVAFEFIVSRSILLKKKTL